MPVTAAQEVVNWSPNFIADGITTIVWGTEGILQPPFAGYIVTSANEEKRIEEIDIENGAGFEAIVILLNKGLNVEVTVVDDTSIAPPTVGTIATLSTPYGAVNALVVGEKADQSRKREGMRTITLKTFNAIAGLH